MERSPLRCGLLASARLVTLRRLLLALAFVSAQLSTAANGCQFYPLGEFMRFVRVPEDLPVGELVLGVEVHRRHNLSLQSADKNDDAKYFRLVELDPERVEIRLARSLENLVDNQVPQSILKFRLLCHPASAHDNSPVVQSVTIYLEDVNNHAPQFLNTPYNVAVDELTPIGLTVFRGIQAVDLDKPNTANSDIYFSIIAGNEDGKFGLENGKPPALTLRKPLDFDAGEHSFQLTLLAIDRGQKPLSSTASLLVTVLDSDDLHPIFSSSVYTTQVTESDLFTNKPIRQAVDFPSPIRAYDQDLSINASVEYDIVSGNELGFFELDPNNGSLFLLREVDREKLPAPAFELQIRARQTNNPTKFGLSKVHVDVVDINDNQPQFEAAVYNISIMENLPNHFSIVQVYATDADTGENAEFVYKLDDASRAFAINAKTGWLTVRDQAKLDRERVDSFQLTVFAEEKTKSVARSNCTVSIVLLDSNDNSPTFQPSNLYKFQVSGDSEVGAVVGKVTATDPDLLGNGQITYEIQRQNSSVEEAPFQLDEKNGYIFLLERPLPKAQYVLLIGAYDMPLNPSERRYSLAVVQIDVVKGDASRSHPEFIGSPYQFWVGNEVGVGTSVGQVKVKDFDPKHTVYDLLHSYYDGVPFAIEERTGIIAVVDDLVKYSRHHYDFEAYVTDSRHTLTTNVSIHIVDPIHTDSLLADTSQQPPIELDVQENTAGAVIGNFRTLLQASLPRDTRAMEFVLANGRDKFAISGEGTLYTLQGLDREEQARYLLTLISQARGVTRVHGIYQVHINVLDQNDNPPTFERQQYEGHVKENVSPGTPVILDHPIRVVDTDEGANAEYRIELAGSGADRFRVDPKSGKIYVGNQNLDREERQLFNMELIVRDTLNQSARAKLQIMVTDLNDNAPQFIHKVIIDPPELDDVGGPRELLRSGSSQPVSVEISSTDPILVPETIPVGSVIARVSASDRDVGDNAKVFYRIVSENSNATGHSLPYLTDKQYLFSRSKDRHFAIDRVSGRISVVKSLKPDTSYALNISASDRGGLRSYTGVRINAYDVNNHTPTWTQHFYRFEIAEGQFLHSEVGTVTATDQDSGVNGQVSYALQWRKEADESLPFYVNQSTGVVFVQGEIDREKRAAYHLQGIATDGGSPPLASKVDIEVKVLDKNELPPVFYNFLSTGTLNGQPTPIYRVTLKDDVPIGSVVTQVFANDTDDPLLGNGIVLFHLTNHHKEFHIDSKNGTIFTSMRLKSNLRRQFNLTVVAQDLGRPSLSSKASVVVRLLDSETPEQETDRLYEQEVYTFQVPHHTSIPLLLAKVDVTPKYRRLKTEFELLGPEDVVSNFRIDSGNLYVTRKLNPNVTHEFLMRGYNVNFSRLFDTRQQSATTDRFLEPNEALVRVRVSPSPIKPNLTFNLKKPIVKPNSPEPAATNKKSHVPSGAAPPTRRYGNSTGTGRKYKPGNGHGTSNLYAGEVAIIVLSSIILLGGLVAAISVSCVRRKRYSRSRRAPCVPVEVHLQKQIPGRMVSNRPLIFPMALPAHDAIMSDHSEATSDTYTDPGDTFLSETHQRVLQSNGYSICPECRKLRKPSHAIIGMPRETRFLSRHIIDRGPLKQVRNFGPRDLSLQSTNDSGIDGSDAQCNCYSHNFSSDSSGRSLFVDNYEDSLMPPIIHPNPKSFRRKHSQRKQNKRKPPKGSNGNLHRVLSEGVVIL